MEQTSHPDGDREIFERVWRRVMPEDRPDCPFTLEEEDGEQRAALPVPAVRTAPAVQVLEPEGESGGQTGLCLGPAAAVHGDALQRYIEDELSDLRYYLALARRSQSGTARALTALAADERRHAKRLSTAYFLISGVRYWPEMRTAPSVPSLLAALRERFLAEQQGAASYQAAADQTADPCLKRLFLELAEEEQEHAWTIRDVLEQM